MNNKEEEIMWDFLSGYQTEEEKRKFLLQLSDNDKLKEEMTETLIRHYGRLKLKEKLADIHKTLPDTVQTRTKQMWYWQMVAVGLILLLPTCLFFFWEDQRIWQENLFQHVFKPYGTADLLNSVKQDSTLEHVWHKAMEYYELASYDKAIPLLKQLQEQGTKPSYLYSFYLGVAYLGLDPPETEKAIASLENVLALNQELAQQARWYIALAYWKQGDFDTARNYFKDISEQTGVFNHKAAKDILNQKSLESIQFIPAPSNLSSFKEIE